jgi:hypothetical protein
MKNEIFIRHSLEKFFGKNNEKVEYALMEIMQILNHPLNEIVDEETKEYKPAYIDASEENLHDGKCRFCGMVWYNCLCSHSD